MYVDPTFPQDPFQLVRFLDAQQSIYRRACAELAEGRKRSHWMWFIFPQITGLGSSEAARRFAISGVNEAIAYLEHPVLAGRLRECTALVLKTQGLTIEQIFGYPDHLKFHSSITLFDRAAAMRDLDDPADHVFNAALNRFFGQVPDHATLRTLDPHRSKRSAVGI